MLSPFFLKGLKCSRQHAVKQWSARSQKQNLTLESACTAPQKPLAVLYCAHWLHIMLILSREGEYHPASTLSKIWKHTGDVQRVRTKPQHVHCEVLNLNVLLLLPTQISPLPLWCLTCEERREWSCTLSVIPMCVLSEISLGFFFPPVRFHNKENKGDKENERGRESARKSRGKKDGGYCN